ncbi:MAG: helix-turn-helix transcriptional regulator [bacterium]|nr:helix-turn-helix transcriptional regulator [bacterium]
MKKDTFTFLRKKIGKTQKETAVLLGISKKAVESYEQGARNIPANIQRILYYLLFKLNMDKVEAGERCWDFKECNSQYREQCIAWLAKEGFFCWFITGKVCIGEKAESGKSEGNCFECRYFKHHLGKILAP